LPFSLLERNTSFAIISFSLCVSKLSIFFLRAAASHGCRQPLAMGSRQAPHRRSCFSCALEGCFLDAGERAWALPASSGGVIPIVSSPVVLELADECGELDGLELELLDVSGELAEVEGVLVKEGGEGAVR